MCGCLTEMLLFRVDIVILDGARQAEELDEPALVGDQRVDVATSQNLESTEMYKWINACDKSNSSKQGNTP